MDVDPKTFQQLGTITVRLHQHSRHWQDAPHLDPADHGIIATAVDRAGQALAEFGKEREIATA